ncbi:efflux RND transporter periplasmic adaptor subunit [Pseudomonas izuensis]|uniref:Efflux RND transporter periplasmic adaptor subunit n=1 Tax=Pseudomonas izuensis TaxID=2684212 RepID=A0ABM7RT69_9PSED|nr:efflux RND transporter periplasmic adaptor subunit [Pseudomonas izuensis]BCX68655.1 efflux RND transporter periplasmic adaptor subunit [Pseudomonas izuensis]
MNVVQRVLSVACLIGLGGLGGYWLARGPQPVDQGSQPKDEPKVLYWYDPMVPQQKFDKPGKSPFMEMELVPRYADGAAEPATVQIDPGMTQNIGLRLATVTRGPWVSSLDAAGVLAFNERDVAQIQARTAGFVERVYARAPDDVLKAGAPLADILVPEWAAAQEEFLALKRMGDAGLLAAARQRLRLTGMPRDLIAQVERSGKVQLTQTLTTPIAGTLQTLNVRAGMTLAAGETLARINGLATVWLMVAVPEAVAGSIRLGQTVEARLATVPDAVLQGTISAILPQTNADSRTLSVRVELPNPDGRLRPGLTAQVRLNSGAGQNVLQVPSEALIRTGKRVLVMLAEGGGRYRPVEVQAGVENAGQTVVLKGLQEGQQVVTSGQFLLDSEASLKGIVAQPAETAGGQP